MKRKLTGSARSSHAAATARNGAKRQRNGDATSAAEKLYTLDDVILVLGDGDFTFSKGLVSHRGGGRNLYATSFDSESKVKAKYSNALETIVAVRAAKGNVVHDVDATKLDRMPRRLVDGGSVPPFFNYVIFNFPHTGQQRVHINRSLLLEFFESARPRLVKTGEVHVTLKNRPPYSNWLVEDQAKAAGFVLKERRKFNHRLFPGYHHRTTDPQAKKFEAELCTTYVFVVNRSKFPFEPIAATQRLADRTAEQDEPAPYTDTIEKEVAELTAATDASSSSKRLRKHKRRRTPEPRGTATGKPTPVAPSAATTTPASTQQQSTQSKRTMGAALWRPLHRR